MPTMTIAGGGDWRRARSMMAWMLARIESTSSPRSPSLAPVSITSTATGSVMIQSMLRRVSADVAPLTPALTTR